MAKSRRGLLGRKGSIPVVLIAVVVLGIFALSAFFMSSSTARLDKRSELPQTAINLAQGAIEEILVKISNNRAGWENVSTASGSVTAMSYKPGATQYVADSTYGARGEAKVADVKVMGRILEQPAGNVAERRKEFFDYMTAAPGFYRGAPTAKNGDSRNRSVDAEWWKDQAVKANVSLRINSTGTREEPGFNQSRGEKGREYYDQFRKGTYANDNGRIARAFTALPVLRYTNTEVADQPSHSSAELADFNAKFQVAMEEVGKRVDERIAGCGGDPDYGVGAYVAAFALGAAAKADADEEEEFRESARDGNITKYSAKLLTLGTEATVKMAGLTVTQPVTAQRVLKTIAFQDAATELRKGVLGYVMYYYNLTAGDLIAMGWARRGSDGKLTPIDQVTAKLNEHFPDSPNPQIYPFDLTKQLGKAR